MMPTVSHVLRAVKPEILADQGLNLAASLRRVRKERGLLQREVAALLRVCHTSVLDWEGGKQPEASTYPKVIAFLGFAPWPPPKTFAEVLLAERRTRGWSMRAAANAVGVDEGTWRSWEKGRLPKSKERQKLSLIFAA